MEGFRDFFALKSPYIKREKRVHCRGKSFYGYRINVCKEVDDLSHCMNP
jgi:hypothetical protein